MCIVINIFQQKWLKMYVGNIDMRSINCVFAACKHALLNTNNEIQDSAKESYYIHNKTHVTLNVHTIRKIF